MKQKMLKVPRRRLIECAILFAAALMLLTSPSAPVLLARVASVATAVSMCLKH